MTKYALKLVAFLAISFTVALVVPRRATADDDDPPTRVARLSFAEGAVSFEPAGTDDWVTAVVNRPMTTGDKLWADRDSRAELHLGSASVRLGASTGFSFLNLDDRTTQLQLTEGTLRIRVRRLERDEIFEIDTPNVAFNVTRPGIYRVNVNEGGDTTAIVVRDGEGQVTGGGQSYMVHADETGIFTGTDQLNADIEGVGSDDDLERWSSERDQREDHSVSRRYVSDDAIGYEDLDQYGGWRDVPEYGSVWFPQVSEAGWAPYRYGHWVWISPWGYTWVEDEPWGFAPFHYGRWVYVGSAWGWVPCRPAAVVGVAYVRPVYAPALVAWVGGPNFAVGVGSVAWFPLGPREVYVPSYRVSQTYVTRVNVTNTTVNTTVVNNYYNTVVVNKSTTVNNVTYVNQRVAGAVTVTSRQVISTSQPVSRNVVRVDERQIASAQVAVRAPAVEPQRQAFVGAARPAQARPPQQIVSRQVVARTAPPPPPPTVDRQQAMVRQNGGQPPAVSEIRRAEPQQARPTAPVRVVQAARPVDLPRNANRQPVPQNVNRPVQAPAQANGPANRENRPNQPGVNNAPNANRPATAPENANRPGNERNQPSAPAPNAQPNRPPATQPNERPNERPERNDRPPSARPANPPANPNTPPPNAQPNRPPATQPNERPDTRRNDRNPQPEQPRRQEPQQERPQPPPRQEERPQPPPRQQEERQQPPPRQQERQQPPPREQERQQPPRQERQQPPPRTEERQQPPPKQERQQQERQKQDKPKEKEKDKEKDKDRPPKS